MQVNREIGEVCRRAGVTLLLVTGAGQAQAQQHVFGVGGCAPALIHLFQPSNCPRPSYHRYEPSLPRNEYGEGSTVARTPVLPSGRAYRLDTIPGGVRW